MANPAALPFSEAIDFFQQKIKLPSSGWTDIWQEQHSHAFVVAGATHDGLVADLYNAVAKAKEAVGYAEFQKSFPEIVKKHGWAHNGAPGWRSKVIYDTNVTQSYNAGREQQMQAVKHLRPYGQYRHTSIEHPRLEHKAWDGLILPLDDPWWNTHTPQNGWGCKCKKYSLSRVDADRELKKAGKDSIDQAPPIEWEEKVVGKNGSNPRTARVPKGIDPGFAYNPGKAWLEPHTVPPLTEKLANLVPDQWPWPKGYKPPAPPVPTPFSRNLLVDKATPSTQVVSDFLDIFEATLTESVVIADKSGSPLVIGSKMFIHGGGSYSPAAGDDQFKTVLDDKSGRKKYIYLLAQSILDPDEIWESWETIKKGSDAGKKFLVRHFMKSFVTADENGNERYMMSIFRKSKDGWDGVTTFQSSKQREFEKRRRGYLAYKK